MDVLERIDKETIIITNYSYKNKLLKEVSRMDKFFNISFLSMKELKNKLYFTFDNRAIYYLMKKYNFKYDVAITYLNNLLYISNKNYNAPKLDKLVEIKRELEDNNLLIYDKYFKDYLNGKKIIFLGFNYFNKFEKNIIFELEKITSVEVIDKDYKKNNPVVYFFNTLEEEVEYVAIEIIKLIEKGIEISNIKITNFCDEYFDMVKKIFSFYNLDIDYRNDKLISTKVVSDFFLLNGSISDRIKVLNEKYNNNSILSELISICNKYISFDLDDIVLTMIKEEVRNKTIPFSKTSNMIEIIDYKNYPVSDLDYVFFIGFNNNVPYVYKDEDYITDNLKDELLLDKTTSLNILEKENSINNILSIKNLVLTYKETSSFDTYLPSNLISDLGLEVKHKKIDLSYSYSDLYSKIKLSKLIDNYLKTGSISNDLKLLYSNFDSNYSSYDNSFKGIDKDLFKDFVSGKYTLSYSSMDNYYKCPFRYYLSNVLRLDVFEDTFVIYLGSLFHYVLENNLKDDKDIDLLINEYIDNNERVLTVKEKFFVTKVKKEIEFSLSFIKDHLSNTSLSKMLFENETEVFKNGDIPVIFKGFVDKIMYEEKDNNSIVSIIDYKTGYVDTDIKKSYFGLSMQLPIYLYLVSKSTLKNISFAGFYIQRVLNNEVSITPLKTYDELRWDNLKLSGYSNSDKDIIYEFDHTFKNSKYIKSLKLNNDESFSYHSKVLSNNQISGLINLVDDKIDGAINEINNCNFKISPKATSKENIGCKYCKFSSICFKENKDVDYINFPKDLSFLGGDNNA